jgi:hypothetical protein
MHLALKKGTKISIALAILVEFFVISLFHETKIPIVDMKVQVSSNFSFSFLEKAAHSLSNWWASNQQLDSRASHQPTVARQPRGRPPFFA